MGRLLRTARRPRAQCLKEQRHLFFIIHLSRALETLPPRLQRILEHKYALGCTDAEGAERAGEALGTYKRLLRQALAELRARIGDEPKAPRVPSEEA